MRAIQDETYMLSLLKFSQVVAKVLLHVLFLMFVDHLKDILLIILQ